jgi:glycosyltransferase involved in cell wall biosynthesis
MVKKVVFVENIDPYRARSGGIGTYLKNLALFLKQKGIPTALIGAGSPPGPGENESSLKIPVDEFTAVTGTKRGHPRYIVTLLFKARKLVLENDVVLHGQRPDVLFPFVIFNRRKRRRKNQKIVCSLHGIHSRAVSQKKGKLRGMVYQWLERKTLKHVDAIIAVGKKVEDYFIEKHPYCKEKITMLPAGTNDREFFPRDKLPLRQSYGFAADDKILVYVGRLEKEKNLALLADAFARVKEEIPNAKLLLVGGGREEEHLKLHVREKGTADVIFHGPVSNEEIPLLLNCADVFTLCSLYESGPIVIREALACNLPVVSTDVGDARSIIEPLPGCFIAEPDPRDFCQKIISALSYPGPADYRHAIAAFRYEHIFNRTLSVYMPPAATRRVDPIVV